MQWHRPFLADVYQRQVENVASGSWNGKSFNLGSGGNHAKIGVFTSGEHHYAIFGDMNQAGALSGDDKACKSAQNGRDGLFFVLDNKKLAESVRQLIAH